MKTKVLIIVLIVLLIVGGVITILFTISRLTGLNSFNVGEFNLSKYQWEIENFPSDKNVGPIDNADTAIEKAKELWLEKFSVVNGQPYNPINGRRIEVSYDSEEECWHINGTLSPNMLGGVPHAIIRKNGEVVAVWHDD